MTMDRNLRQSIDACRPHSDDLREPEMASLAKAIEQDPRVAEVYQLSQRWDAKVAAAMAEVAVPADLADRLCERLLDSSPLQEGAEAFETAGDLKASSQETLESQTSLQPITQTKSGVSRIGRRTWFVSAAAILLVSVGLGVFFSNQEVEESLTLDRLRIMAHEWYEVIVDVDEESWESDLKGMLKTHPLSENVGSSALAYAQLPTESFGDPIVYDMTPWHWGQIGTDKAFLVVVPTRPGVDLSGIRVTPPSGPNSSHAPSSGVAVAVWRRDTTLYVLIIKGRHDRYEQLIEPISPEFT